MSKTNIVPISDQPASQEESPNRLSFTLEEMLKEFENGAVPRSKFWQELITALYDTANHVVTGVTAVADVKPDNIGNIPLLPKDIDAPAMVRMEGADERERQSTEDVFGRQLFYGDACKVVHQYGGYYEVLSGNAYVAGIRFFYPGKKDILIEKDDLPTFVWVDVSLHGDAMSKNQSVVEVIVSEQDQIDYIDSNNIQHYLEKISNIDTHESAQDLRTASINFVALRANQTQPITHKTLLDAISDDNSSRQFIKLGELAGATFMRAIDQDEYDRYHNLAKFIDTVGNQWIINSIILGYTLSTWYGEDSDAFDTNKAVAELLGVEARFIGIIHTTRQHELITTNIGKALFDCTISSSGFGDIDNHKQHALLIKGIPADNSHAEYSGSLRIVNNGAICHGLVIGDYDSGSCLKTNIASIFVRNFTSFQRCGFLRNDNTFGVTVESVTAHSNYHNIAEGGNENHIGSSITSGATEGWGHYCGSISRWREINNSQGFNTVPYQEGNSNSHGLVWAEGNRGAGGLTYTGKLNNFGTCWSENNDGIQVHPFAYAQKGELPGTYLQGNVFETLQIDSGQERDSKDIRTKFIKTIEASATALGDIFNSTTITTRGTNPADFRGSRDVINGELPRDTLLQNDFYMQGSNIRKVAAGVNVDNSYSPATTPDHQNVIRVAGDDLQTAIDALPNVLDRTITIYVTSSATKKIYINGVQQTLGQQDTIVQDSNFQFGASGAELTFGMRNAGDWYFDGAMSHIHMIDGTAYDASAFGETDTTTGEWKAKTSPSVTYGTNGFLILKDGNTITDQSSNSNAFTLGGGTLTDLKDNPDNVFATINPLDNYYAGGTFTEGNNTVKHGSSSWTYNTSTLKIPENTKFYFEAKVISMEQCTIGIEKNVSSGTDDYLGKTNGVGFRGTQGNVYKDGSDAGGTFATYTVNDIISVACDTVNNRIFFGKNGAWLNSGDPTSSTGAITIDDNTDYFFALGDNTSGARGKWSANFGNGYFGTTAITTNSGNGYSGAEGSSKFNYTVPTGYSALSTKGLNE